MCIIRQSKHLRLSPGEYILCSSKRQRCQELRRLCNDPAKIQKESKYVKLLNGVINMAQKITSKLP